MERREVGIPHTRQKSSEGHLRALPNLGASGAELRRVSFNGQFDPEISEHEVRKHLGVTNLVDGYGRNYRNPRFRLPVEPKETDSLI